MTDNVDEVARRRALDTYRVLDSLPEAAYDDIVKLASTICDVPVALVSLIDRDRQWFKARVGMELRETGRDVAFCDHAIRQPKLLMEVPDARADARFANNPLVTGANGIRFYAGMPLITPGGAAIGTVCVIDHQPRELNNRQREALGALARLTMNLLQAQQREREMERAALLATVSANEQAETVQSERFTIMIVEVQDYANAVATRGERTTEKLLKRLDQLLEAPLRQSRGDSVSRVSGGAEVIVVIHGEDTSAQQQAIAEALQNFESESQLRVLSAAADSAPNGESAPLVFMRADEALSQLKDQLIAAAA